MSNKQSNDGYEYHFDNPWHGEALTRVLDPDQPFRENFDRVISVTSGGKLLGGVTYDGFLHRSVQMHVASFSPKWLTREMLWLVFDYPFNQLKVERVFGPVASTNKKAIAFDEKIGFTEHTRLVGAVPGGDLIIFSMERADCKWLKIKPRLFKAGKA